MIPLRTLTRLHFNATKGAIEMSIDLEGSVDFELGEKVAVPATLCSKDPLDYMESLVSKVRREELSTYTMTGRESHIVRSAEGKAFLRIYHFDKA